MHPYTYGRPDFSAEMLDKHHDCERNDRKEDSVVAIWNGCWIDVILG